MNLRDAIAKKLKDFQGSTIQSAFQELSRAYRGHEAHIMSGDRSELFVAYAAGRMLATHAVVNRVLSEYRALGGETPCSWLDIGSGPGTASFAALEHFDLDKITLIEKEPQFRTLCLALANETNSPLQNADWMMGDVSSLDSLPKADLAIASYSLGELEENKALEVASLAFANSRLGFILVEPGTPKGSALVVAIRERLISEGALIAAPCPHAMPCPMKGSDFCHFSQRLERERFHRDAKSASLPYEDEKYAYVIATKPPLTRYNGRIVKRPLRGSGHVTLDLCTEGKLERSVIARSQKDLYKIARKVEWGERWL